MDTFTWGWHGFTTNSYTLYGVYIPTLTTEYQSYYGLGSGGGNANSYPFGKISADKKTIYWYAKGKSGVDASGGQLNASGRTYYWIALG